MGKILVINVYNGYKYNMQKKQKVNQNINELQIIFFFFFFLFVYEAISVVGEGNTNDDQKRGASGCPPLGQNVFPCALHK